MKKRVLIIAYYWPPAGGPGVQRWIKFVKYLPEFGIQPIVFVPENPSYPITDPSFEKEVSPDAIIIKRPIKEPYGIASLLSRKQTKTISSGIIPKQGRQNLLQKVFLYLRGNFFIPDARVGWIAPSVKYLKNYVKENHIETLITTGPPHSLHLIGLHLKLHFKNVTWLADFRDPWTTISYHNKLMMTSKTKAKHKKLEQEVLSTADQIVVTSPTTKKEFSLLTNTPIELITNGFDTASQKSSSIKYKSDHFVLGHFGSLLSDRNPIILWETLSELIQESVDFKKVFTFYLVGKVSQEVVDSIQKYHLNDYFKIVDYLPHSELAEYYKKVQALVLIEIDSQATKAIIPGKLFEYLASRKPIIAIGPENGDVSLLIEETVSGSYFNYKQKTALKTYIKALFNKDNPQQEPNEDAIKKYHRKSLTEQLATLLKTI